MKKKFLSAMLTIAMAGVCVLSAGTTARAAEGTYTDRGSYDEAALSATQDAVGDDPASTANAVNIGVNAQTSGGGDIVYSVKVTWGNMKFEYNYGSTWNPVTHTYTPAEANQQDGGWVRSWLDRTNNKITVINNSNFPIDAKFAYSNTDDSLFNAEQSATSVTGMFAENNDDLLGALDDPNTTNVAIPVPTLHLNTDTTRLAEGTVYYYQGTDNSDYDGEVYFSLIGKPDRGIELTSMQSVGSIQVTITAAEGVHSATAPAPAAP